MRVLWPHNFDLAVKNSGIFMTTLAEGVRDLGVELDLLYLGALGDPRNLRRAFALVQKRSEGYDIVHAQYGSLCAVACSGARAKTVLSLRGSDWHRYQGPDRRESYHGLVAHWLSRVVARKYDCVVAMSNRMATEIVAKTGHPDVAVIPDPIDLRLFSEEHAWPASAPKGDLSPSGFSVLFTTVHRDNPIKRGGLAAEAVALAERTLGKVKLRVASGLTHTEMPDFVAGCDVALSTSTHEGWPNAIKEALACNVPFVATDVSDLRGIADIEPSCFVVGANSQELGQALIEVLQMPHRPDLRRHVAVMDLPLVSAQLVDKYQKLRTR